MNSRRSRLEIYIDVLKIIKAGDTKPTRIMYGANLSWKILQNVLCSMVDQGLVEEIDKSGSRDKRTNKVYQITSKGEGVIKYFGQAQRLLNIEEEYGFNPLQTGS